MSVRYIMPSLHEITEESIFLYETVLGEWQHPVRLLVKIMSSVRDSERVEIMPLASDNSTAWVMIRDLRKTNVE